MPKPSIWLLIACLGVALAACHEAPDAQASAQTSPEFKTADEAPAHTAPSRRLRLAIQLIAASEPAQPAPAVPPAEPTPSADIPPADPPGFRITVPMCQRAERQDDPLAKTAECTQLLDAAKAQAAACKQAFENGDDKNVLSPACRQAARFR